MVQDPPQRTTMEYMARSEVEHLRAQLLTNAGRHQDALRDATDKMVGMKSAADSQIRKAQEEVAVVQAKVTALEEKKCRVTDMTTVTAQVNGFFVTCGSPENIVLQPGAGNPYGGEYGL